MNLINTLESVNQLKMRRVARHSRIDNLSGEDPKTNTESDFFTAQEEEDKVNVVQENKKLEEENSKLKELIENLKLNANTELVKENQKLFIEVEHLKEEVLKLQREKEVLAINPNHDELIKMVIDLEFKNKSIIKENEYKSERIVDLLSENKKIKSSKVDNEEYINKIAKLEEENQLLKGKLPSKSNLFAEIVGYIDGNPVYYRVKVCQNNESYEIKKRYNDFYTLYTELQKLKIKDIPTFPEKLIMGNRNVQILVQRCELLGKFVEYISSNKDLVTQKFILSFFAKSSN